MASDQHLAVVIMAAGKGTRMKNPDKAKVMYELSGRPMIEHVVDMASCLGPDRTVVIVGWQKDSVIGYLRSGGKPVICVEQSPQLGTGHAVMQAEPVLDGFSGDVLVLSGDVPLLTERTSRGLVDHHRRAAADVTVLTAELQDATGYGRILRGPTGAVTGIAEEKDATDEQRRIREINSGIYVFRSGRLFEGLKHITPENAQKEYYLTDILGYGWKHGWSVHALRAPSPVEILGINTLQQLDEAQAVLTGRNSG